MSGKTKADLLVEIESLRHQLEVKDDYISTLEDLLDAETKAGRGLKGKPGILQTAFDAVTAEHVKANKGRIMAEMRRRDRKKFYVERFLFHHLEKGLTPFKAETRANNDVYKKFNTRYEKSSLNNFRHEPELKKYFTERKRPLQN